MFYLFSKAELLNTIEWSRKGSTLEGVGRSGSTFRIEKQSVRSGKSALNLLIVSPDNVLKNVGTTYLDKPEEYAEGLQDCLRMAEEADLMALAESGNLEDCETTVLLRMKDMQDLVLKNIVKIDSDHLSDSQIADVQSEIDDLTKILVRIENEISCRGFEVAPGSSL
jgi:hypothetical protein